MKKILSIFLASLFLMPTISFAHPGKLDKKGGHTCRKNCDQYGLKNGQYHKH